MPQDQRTSPVPLLSGAGIQPCTRTSVELSIGRRLGMSSSKQWVNKGSNKHRAQWKARSYPVLTFLYNIIDRFPVVISFIGLVHGAKIGTALFNVSGRSSGEVMCQIRSGWWIDCRCDLLITALVCSWRAGDHPLAAGAAVQVSAFSLLPKLGTRFRQVMNDYIARCTTKAFREIDD